MYMYNGYQVVRISNPYERQGCQHNGVIGCVTVYCSTNIPSIYKVRRRDVVDLKSQGCRKLKQKNTGVTTKGRTQALRRHVDERCGVHWCCCTAAATTVVPMPYCTDAF